MIISSIETVPGYNLGQTLGLVRGSTVRSRHIGKDILAGFRNIVGGEVKEYTKLQAKAREQALQRMIAEATQLQADAVVGVRMMTSMIMDGASEILIYGTAVKLIAQT